MDDLPAAILSNIVVLAIARAILLLGFPLAFRVRARPLFRAVPDVVIKPVFGFYAGFLTGLYVSTYSPWHHRFPDDNFAELALPGIITISALCLAAYWVAAFCCWLATRYRKENSDGSFDDQVKWRLNSEWTVFAAFSVSLIAGIRQTF